MAITNFFTTNNAGNNPSEYRVVYNPAVEGQPATLVVTRISGTGDDIIWWNTASGTATTGVDFTESSGQFSLLLEGSITLTIPTSSDNVTEGTEHFFIRFFDELKNQQVMRLDLQQEVTDAANLAPDAVNDSFNVTEDTPLNLSTSQLTRNDTDGNGDVLTITSVQSATNGSVSLRNGAVTFTPASNYNGPASFTYTVSDGKGGFDTATVNLTVTAVNDAPVLVSAIIDQVSAEDAAWTFAIPAATFADVDSARLTLTATLNDGAPLPSWLNFNTTTGTFSGTPPKDFDGELQLTVTASDGSLSVSDTFKLDVTPVNDAPVVATAIAGQASDEDAAWTFAIPAGTFADVDSATLTLTATLNGAALPSWLNFDKATGTFSGTPPKDFDGEFELTVTASDGSLSVSDTFKLDITPVNDAPVVATVINDQASDEDAAWTFTVPAGTFADVDNAALTLTATLGDGSGLPSWLTFNAATRTFSGTPPKDFDGELQLTVTASDGSLSVSDTFKLDISPVNDAPVATGGDTSGDEDTVITGRVGGTDVDGDAPTFRLVEAVEGLTLNANGSYSYKPAANFHGEVSFRYVANDGILDSAPQVVKITVNAVNDAPVANADAGSAQEDGAAVTLDVLANDTDVDTGDTKTLVSVNNAGARGLATIINGMVSYDVSSNFQALKAGQTASDTFTYTMKDSAGVEKTASVTMTITGVNDGPVAVNDSGRATEDGGAVVLDVLGNDTDADEGDTKSLLSLNNTGTIGAISIANGKIAYDPGTYFQSLKAGQTTTDTFSYTMKDEAGAMSTATVTMTITGVNDGPGAVNDEDFVDEDQTLVLDLLSNDTDVDGDALTIVEARAQFGTATIFTVEGKTIVSYTASADSFDKLATGATATDTITYRISDGQGGFSTATVKITVKGINDGIVILGTNQSDSISGVPDRLGRDRDETIEGFNGADILNGMGGADRLIGGNGDDILSGGNGWDELYGDHGNDRLDGGAGLDFLDGGLGDDRLFGGADADIFFFGKANGNDTILDFQGGVDTLQFGTGVSIKNKTMVDTNGDGVADSTLLQLSTGSVTLIGVTSSQWDFFA